MTNNAMMTTAYLQEKAVKCRQLARQARSNGIATELEKLACDYDKDAERQEASDPFLAKSALR